MGKLMVFTADDEDPDCNRCDHCCNEDVCIRFCGAKHGWARYERTILEDSE